MLRMHFTKIAPGSFRHTCLSCLDSKRHVFILLLFLFIVPTLYSLSNITVEPQHEEESDVCSQLLDILLHSNRTLCSEKADLRGNRQRIISLSIFGPKENKIFADDNFSQLITPLLAEAATIFPSWTVRLYSDQLTIDRLNLNNLTNSATNIDICNVNQLPILGNVDRYLAGKLWRFLPALDPTVDYVSSRDLDSPLTERELVVMEEFLNSSYWFLTLRDHPLHGVPVLGGLWTAALHRNRQLFLQLFSVLLDKKKARKYILIHDQTLLRDLIWPKVKHQTLAYDSYTCQDFHGTDQRPFPTQRPSIDCHLGCIRPCCLNSSKPAIPKACPEQCRPKNHLDWTFC